MTTRAVAPIIREPKPQRAESNQSTADPGGTLLSVNVGLPKDVSWQGRTVFTGVFKTAVPGPAGSAGSTLPAMGKGI